jgi:hypothetical protein
MRLPRWKAIQCRIWGGRLIRFAESAAGLAGHSRRDRENGQAGDTERAKSRESN